MDRPGFEEVLFSLRAMRRLKPDPVPEQDLRYIVEAATQAATGENRQRWGFVVVTDAELRRRVAEVYLEIATSRVRPSAEGETAATDPAELKVYRNAWRFAQRIDQVPALIVCCARGPRPDDVTWTSTYYGSLYPAVQNLMLAARYCGLGTVLTTLHLIEEPRIKQILEIPDEMNTEAIIPVGYPEGRFAQPLRAPAAEVTHWERWGQHR